MRRPRTAMNPHLTIQHLRAAFARDPKRVGLLVGLSLVMGFLVVRHFMSAGPPQATAEAIVTQTQRQVAQSNQLAGIARISRRWSDVPLPQMSRDPFADQRRRPITPATEVEPSEPAPPTFTEADGAFWKQLEGTLAVRAEHARRVDNSRNEVLAAAAGLKVQSIVAGADERALVGDRVVRTGDRIELPEGVVFRVEAIRATQIVVSSAGFRVAVGMTGTPRLVAPASP